MVKNILDALVFRCENSSIGCTQELTYTEILEHTNNCNYNFVSCEKCKQSIKRNEPPDHDCISFLRKKMELFNEEKEDLLRTIDEKNRRIEDLQRNGKGGFGDETRGEFEKLAIKEYVFLSRLAETAESYNDMVEFITRVVRVKGDSITKEERNLLTTAFKQSL